MKSVFAYYEFMLTKEQPSLFAPRPKSFAALMEMYETNYLQLRLLCGDLRVLPLESRSTITGGIPVLLQVMERSRHTTTLLMTYLFEAQQGGDNRPDIVIRVYHDSRQAEVVGHRCRFVGETVRYWAKDLDTMLLCRWRINRFLYKWMNYLRRQGHYFG